MKKLSSGLPPFFRQIAFSGTLFLVTLFLVTLCGGAAARSQDSAVQVDFAREILPILSGKCFLCHGPDSQGISDLRLDLPDEATADRGGYRAIDHDVPARSAVLARIHSADDPMPPLDAAPLTDTERQKLTQWIEQGGAYAVHWAFVPPQHRPAKSAPDASGSGAVDAYIAEPWQARRLSWAPPAEKTVVARRVALVLTGLPPKVEWLQDYLAADDDQAYERLVDRLLDDPAFGLNQARFWLDAVRYGDTHGLHLDNRRGMFPYRDWVVKALNDNLPWDQFITWQLAGDLLPNPSLEQWVASGFIRLNPSTAEGGAIPEEFQAKNSFDRTESFGTVFLGLSLTCARCHTHKYDPITHEDYFRLLAYFNSTAEAPLDGNKYDYEPVVLAPANQRQWEQWHGWNRECQALLAMADQQLGQWLAATADDPGTVSSRLEWRTQWAAADDLQKLELLGQDAGPWTGTEFPAKAKSIREQRQRWQADWTTTLVAKELETPRQTRVLQRGEYDLPLGETLHPAPLPIIGDFSQPLPANRLGLAQWLLHPDHPLLTRVLVNRFWLQVFGAGLVRTPEEFGLQGQYPTHPELLDYLALEFRAQGWDLKRFLKMLVMTKTFRQSAAWRDDLDDPDNLWWARGPGYRLDAEVLRDLALLVSGRMIDELGGEGFKPFQPPGMWEALAHPASNTKTYQADGVPDVYRRSLYMYWKRTSPHPTMTLFDAPSRETSCVQRSRSNTPLQSLALLNEPQRVHLGLATAERLLTTCSHDEERLNVLFQELASRPATELEARVCLQLLADFRQRFTNFPADARALLDGQAGIDARGELDPSELAAWCQLSLTVLASDAVIMLY